MDKVSQKGGKFPVGLVFLFLALALLFLIGGTTLVTSMFLHFLDCMRR